MYLINFQNIYTFTNQKALLHTLLLLVSKIVESLSVSLKKSLIVTTTVIYLHYKKLILLFYLLCSGKKVVEEL